MARDLTLRLAEDRPGELAELVKALSQSGVNVDGLAEVDGIVHVLSRDPSATRTALRAAGYAIEAEREVLIMPMPDRPGELSLIMRQLADSAVNVRFVYMATDTRVVIGVDDVMKAREALGSSKN